MVYKNQLLLSFLLVALITLLSGCADKKDTASSCLVQLDAEQYQTVAENTNCSNYHRASGYLGLAGMTFSNFMKKGATDNLVKTLGITALDNASVYSSGNRNYLTKAICLVGPDNLTTSSRCTGQTTRTGTRGKDAKEISFFALLGDLIYLNHGVLDTDLNGTISTTESDNFSNLSNKSSLNSSGGGTTINTTSNNWEVITSLNRYIFNNGLTKYNIFSDNYTFSTPSETSNAATIAASATEVRPIYKLDNMTDITGGNDLTSRKTLVTELTNVSTNLNSELSKIGLKDNSSMRTSLTNGLKKLDNGGFKADGTTKCDAAKALDVVYLLVKDAADNSTVSTASNLYDLNLVSLSDLKSSINSGIDPTTPVSGVTFEKARLIYAANVGGTSHTDSFESAHPDLQEAIKNTRSLGTESSIKGDGKVIFRELLCIGDN